MVNGYPAGFYPTDPSMVGNSMGPSLGGFPLGGNLSLQYFSGPNYNNSMLYYQQQKQLQWED
eukprot:CAMPEP_0170484184 /NCGR_PEP_ID=MMETSP0208-20121228/3706_1 /TAXON_ID=197538 /ORGANISM="Strombidium inclinatum, Strain S3" /LENGTH=61 /DNA_ID=CAMNT_0010757457 /DNA_START=681 /DNA_END=866 /DNA_ORIENTATION=+